MLLWENFSGSEVREIFSSSLPNPQQRQSRPVAGFATPAPPRLFASIETDRRLSGK
jgi:hypothetical protein